MAGLGGRGCGGRLIRRGASAGLALLLGAPLALAQTANPAANVPPRLSFDLSTGLTHDDNPDLSVGGSKSRTSLDTGLGLSFNSATPTQALTFSLNGLLRADATDGVRLRDPALSLGYKTDTGNTRLGVNGLYQRSEVDAFTPTTLSDGTVSGVTATTGTITTQTAGFSYETGVKAPLGFALSGQYDGRAYSDTTDASLIDTHARQLSASVIWRLATGGQVTLGALQNGTDYADASQTRRRASDVTLGYSQLLRPDLKLQTSLGESRNTTRASGAVTNESSGLTGSVGVEQTLANGTVSAKLALERDGLGARQVLSFGRSLTLPAGSLSATAGIWARSGGTAQWIGSLTYAYALPADSLNLSLSRQIALNSDDVDQANTVLGLNWQHRVNAVSSVGLSVDLAATGSAGNGAVDAASRQSLRATWSHDLARDWQLNAGYQFRSFDQTSTGTATSNSVFVTVSRKFVLLR